MEVGTVHFILGDLSGTENVVYELGEMDGNKVSDLYLHGAFYLGQFRTSFECWQLLADLFHRQKEKFLWLKHLIYEWEGVVCLSYKEYKLEKDLLLDCLEYFAFGEPIEEEEARWMFPKLKL